jgi:hypothetical protein
MCGCTAPAPDGNSAALFICIGVIELSSFRIGVTVGGELAGGTVVND